MAPPFASLPICSLLPSTTEEEWSRRCVESLQPRIITPLVDGTNIFLLNPRATKLSTFLCQFCGKQMSLYTLVAQHWTGTARSCQELNYSSRDKTFTAVIGTLPPSPSKHAYRQPMNEVTTGNDLVASPHHSTRSTNATTPPHLAAGPSTHSIPSPAVVRGNARTEHSLRPTTNRRPSRKCASVYASSTMHAV